MKRALLLLTVAAVASIHLATVWTAGRAISHHPHRTREGPFTFAEGYQTAVGENRDQGDGEDVAQVFFAAWVARPRSGASRLRRAGRSWCSSDRTASDGGYAEPSGRRTNVKGHPLILTDAPFRVLVNNAHS